MRQNTITAKASSFRLFLFSTLLLVSFNQAFASGAKMPTVTDPSVTDIPAVDGTSGGTTSSPSDPSTLIPPSSNASSYSHLDPNHEVPSALLTKAINYFDANKARIKNKSTLGVIDFSQHNSKERFYLIDMLSGQVDRYLVAHGKNSDPDYDGYATIFSNEPGSEKSSQGFYLTAETYEGSHGYSLKLDGLSITNSNARSREIVIHPADYVQPGSKIGRSWGCPALDPRYSVEVINRIKGGMLIYAQ
jgi:hypothetical protein